MPCGLGGGAPALTAASLPEQGVSPALGGLRPHQTWGLVRAWPLQAEAALVQHVQSVRVRGDPACKSCCDAHAGSADVADPDKPAA